MSFLEDLAWTVAVVGPLIIVFTFLSLLVAKEIIRTVQPTNSREINKSLDAAIVPSATMFALVIALHILRNIDVV